MNMVDADSDILKKYSLDTPGSVYDISLRISNIGNYKISIIRTSRCDIEGVLIMNTAWTDGTLPILCPNIRNTMYHPCYVCDIAKYLSFEHKYLTGKFLDMSHHASDCQAIQHRPREEKGSWIIPAAGAGNDVAGLRISPWQDIYRIDCMFDIDLTNDAIRLSYNHIQTFDNYQMWFTYGDDHMHLQEMLYNYKSGIRNSWRYECDAVEVISRIIGIYGDKYPQDIINREIVKFVNHMLSKFGPEIT